MDKDSERTNLTKQLELYSNSIIAFIVFQGLGYCYQFGTNSGFSNSVKCNIVLAIGLICVLSLTMILALIGNYLIGKKTSSMVSFENSALVRNIYRGKLVVIVLFGLLPILVTLYFGIIETHQCL